MAALRADEETVVDLSLALGLEREMEKGFAVRGAGDGKSADGMVEVSVGFGACALRCQLWKDYSDLACFGSHCT